MKEMREACKVLKKQFENKDKVIGAEIGVCYGEHADSLLYNIPNLHLHLVDDLSEMRGIDGFGTSFDFIPEFGRELKNWSSEIYTWHKKTSLEAASEIKDDSLDFVYIDACHHTEAVKQDCRAWYPKVKVGGIICGHDYNNIYSIPEDDVKGAVNEFFQEVGKEVHSGENINNIVPTQKTIHDWWVFK